MKYAIINISGKQQIISPGNYYDVDFITGTKTDDYLTLNRVLLLKTKTTLQCGTPILENIKIPVKVIKHIKDKKQIIVKTKPKKGYTRTSGFRAQKTRIFII